MVKELGAGRGKESSQGPQGRGGLNAFTLLKQHRIESVSCDRVDAWMVPMVPGDGGSDLLSFPQNQLINMGSRPDVWKYHLSEFGR